MKRLAAILLPILMLSLSACVAQGSQASPTPSVISSQVTTPSASQIIKSPVVSVTPSASPSAAVKESYTATSYIKPVNDNDMYASGLTRVKVNAVNLAKDKLAVVELYTSAQKDDKGEFMWDDGQNWALTVRYGDKMYLLLEKKYVQMGDVTFETLWKPETNMSKITVKIKQHEFLDSFECIYEESDDRFARVDLPQKTVTK